MNRSGPGEDGMGCNVKVRAVASGGVGGVTPPNNLVSVGKFSVCRQKGERRRKRRGKEEGGKEGRRRKRKREGKEKRGKRK